MAHPLDLSLMGLNIARVGVPVSAVQVGLFSAIALANVVMVFFLLRNVIEEGV